MGCTVARGSVGDDGLRRTVGISRLAFCTDDGHPRGVSLDAMAQRRGMVHTLPLRGFQEGAVQLDRDAPSKEVD